MSEEKEIEDASFDGMDKLIAYIKTSYQPILMGYVFFTARKGHISNPSSLFLPSPAPPPPPPPPPPGQANVTFVPMRNGAPFTGTGYVTVNGINHVTSLVGSYTTTYQVGTVLSVSFTGLGITCTPTANQTYTVTSDANQNVTINIPC